MKIKRENVVNAAYYFPVDYDEFMEIMNEQDERFFAFNGRVFDKIKTKDLDYSKAICMIEDTDNEGFEYLIPNTKIISGFPAVGKSYLFENNKDLILLDSDSSNFSWIEKGVRHPDFPNNYIQHIKENIGEADIILVSSHKVVRDALKENNIPYTVVYPYKSLKHEYMQRYIDRGNDRNFITMIDKNWDNFIDEMEVETFPTKLHLNKNEHLKDILVKSYCPTYKEFCSVNETNADEYEGNPCTRCKQRGKTILEY